MVNFFRKKRKKLADDNKTVKYARYAIGEIALVVVGILIALNINNWNEQRKLNLQEQELLEGLKIEFTINQDRLKKVIHIHEKSNEAANEVLRYFNQDVNNFRATKFDSLLYNIDYGWTFNPRKGLLNSVIASGHINLISNTELKTHLASFEDMVDDTKEESIAIRRLYEKYESIIYEYLNIGRENSIDYKTHLNEGFRSDVKRFFKDIRVYNMINNASAWRYDLLDEEAEIMSSINRILELISQELKK